MVKSSCLVAVIAAAVVIASTNGASVSKPPSFATVPLGKHVGLAATRSRVVEQQQKLGVLPNGSSIPANGDVWPTAIYWTMVEVGSPPRSFPVAIDSGSGDLDISGKGCQGCVVTPPNIQYDHTASSSSKPEFPFRFSNTYQTCDLRDPTAPCTITGSIYEDDVSLAGLGPVKVTLGSIEKQTSNFDQFKQIDGVMGFTQGGKENVFAQLVANNKCENIWAMCMQEGSKSNGSLTIGGVDPRLSNGTVDYVDDSGEGFHAVDVDSITVHNGATTSPSSTVSVGGSVNVGGSAILDTGTNILLVGTKVLKGIEAAMCTSDTPNCEALWAKTCVDLTDADMAKYPKLTLELKGGVSLDLNVRDYLLQGSPLADKPSQYCIGIQDGGSAGGSGFIIGDTIMRNYYLVFDLKNKAIGWGPVSDKCGSI